MRLFASLPFTPGGEHTKPDPHAFCTRRVYMNRSSGETPVLHRTSPVIFKSVVLSRPVEGVRDWQFHSARATSMMQMAVMTMMRSALGDRP